MRICFALVFCLFSITAFAQEDKKAAPEAPAKKQANVELPKFVPYPVGTTVTIDEDIYNEYSGRMPEHAFKGGKITVTNNRDVHPQAGHVELINWSPMGSSLNQIPSSQYSQGSVSWHFGLFRFYDSKKMQRLKSNFDSLEDLSRMLFGRPEVTLIARLGAQKSIDSSWQVEAPKALVTSLASYPNRYAMSGSDVESGKLTFAGYELNKEIMIIRFVGKSKNAGILDPEIKETKTRKTCQVIEADMRYSTRTGRIVSMNLKSVETEFEGKVKAVRRTIRVLRTYNELKKSALKKKAPSPKPGNNAEQTLEQSH